MSLILQALKKAEAERELGRVPTLASAEPLDERPSKPRHTLAWIALGGAVLVLVAMALVFWPAPAPQPVVAAAPAAMPAPAPVPAAHSAPVVTAGPAPTMPPGQAPAVQALKPKPAASTPLPTQDQLPAELQRKLPNLAVTGTIWSSTPADRMLMIAGQVLHEGDRITPELEVQSIGQREAVLRVQGTAFRLPY